MSVAASVLADGQQVDKAALRRYLEHRETLNLLDYGADPTGRADSAPALQKALDEAAGRRIDIPAGVYLLSRGVGIKAPAALLAAPKLIGAGAGATRFDCRMGSGAAFTVDQSAAYRFASQGVIEGVSFSGDKAGAGVDALRFTGAWGWRLSDVAVANFPGDGISCPARLDLGANPDGWQTILRMEDCRIARCGGWGLDAAAGTGGIFTLIDCAFHDCGGGGLRVSGPTRFSAGMVSGCGHHGGADAAGLRLFKSGGLATPQLLLLERIEFDGNLGVNLRLEAALGGLIRQCRFISRITQGKGMSPPIGVLFGGGTGTASALDLEQCYVRAPGEANSPAFTAFDFAPAGGYGRISIDAPHWITLAPHHRKLGAAAPDAGVRLTEAGSAAPTGAATKGPGPAAVLGAKTADQILPAGKATPVSFDRPPRLPAAGLWRIEVWATLQGAAPGEVIEATLSLGAHPLRTAYLPIAAAPRQTIALSATAQLEAGATPEFRLKAASSANTRILAGADLTGFACVLA